MPLQIINETEKGGGCAMTLWTQLHCRRCRQKIRRLEGYMEEPSADGGPKGVEPYHYGCWYALLKERRDKWTEPFSADLDTPEAARM
jgi:hypothetical protein